MRLRLIAVGSRMPKWVEEGWHEYAKRLPSELALELVEIPLNEVVTAAQRAQMPAIVGVGEFRVFVGDRLEP
ncbi:23S rRNA (pseudouridine(1915)-N(3))-methyltransferase RlmH, partial [Pseudomonas mandelii]|uniref:23S rRNA (pseudouridine(1915)-N(3))-methyltransferase RlmH n=1 Tax=Pseudomonas mandelii TaxID=75612 RepID=UPI003D02E63D